MTTIKKINILSSAKVMSAINAVFGFLSGLLITGESVYLFMVYGDLYFEQVGVAELHQLGAVIFYPIEYGIAGFVIGALIAFAYNKLVKYIGGIQIELSDTNEKTIISEPIKE